MRPRSEIARDLVGVHGWTVEATASLLGTQPGIVRKILRQKMLRKEDRKKTEAAPTLPVPSADRITKCKHCGVHFRQGGKPRMTCSERCRIQAGVASQRAKRRWSVCAFCGKDFTLDHKTKPRVTCSEECHVARKKTMRR